MLRSRVSLAEVAPAMNVLFVTADQWRGDCLSCLGHPAVRTPNLDRLAGTGCCSSGILPRPRPAAHRERRSTPASTR